MTAWGACVAGWVCLLVAGAPAGPRRTVPTQRHGSFRGIAGGRIAAMLGHRRRQRRERDRAVEIAGVADLLAVGLSVGLNVRDAIEALVRHGAPGTDGGLGSVVASVRAGAALEHALEEWSTSYGDPAHELATVLVAAERRGVAIGASLARLAADLRRRRRRSAEAAARRLTVRMLLPLVCCVLPAFGLLSVVPMVVVGLGDALRSV